MQLAPKKKMRQGRGIVREFRRKCPGFPTAGPDVKIDYLVVISHERGTSADRMAASPVKHGYKGLSVSLTPQAPRPKHKVLWFCEIRSPAAYHCRANLRSEAVARLHAKAWI